MEINEIIKLIEVVSEHGLTSFVLEENGSKLSMKKEKETIVTTNTVIPASVPYQPAGIPASATAAAAVNTAPEASAGGEAAKAAQTESAGSGIGSEKVIKSPLVGTFFEAPSQDAAAFVKVGDTVKKGQIIGIIEAMKLLNEIESDYDGVVEAILVKNAEVVEYGQPMFRIK